MIHVVIVKPPYLRAILAGEKTMECRLSKTAVPPYRQVAAGERLFIKVSGGPFGATAIVGEVMHRERLTPGDVDQLRRNYDAWIKGEPAY
jgi:hypothetical protein